MSSFLDFIGRVCERKLVVLRAVGHLFPSSHVTPRAHRRRRVAATMLLFACAGPGRLQHAADLRRHPCRRVIMPPTPTKARVYPRGAREAPKFPPAQNRRQHGVRAGDRARHVPARGRPEESTCLAGAQKKDRWRRRHGPAAAQRLQLPGAALEEHPDGTARALALKAARRARHGGGAARRFACSISLRGWMTLNQGDWAAFSKTTGMNWEVVSNNWML